MTFSELGGAIIKWAAVATVFTTVGGWAWQQHNTFLMEMLSPLLRASYAARINNYRAKACMGDFSNSVDLDIAMAEYKELVGRDISDRDCDTF